MSTSKTTALVWTYTAAATLLSFLIARWLGHPEGYQRLISTGLNAQYALLFGRAARSGNPGERNRIHAGCQQ